jgi:hypothetical protein
MASDMGIGASTALESGYHLACQILSVEHLIRVREQLVSIFDDYKSHAN